MFSLSRYQIKLAFFIIFTVAGSAFSFAQTPVAASQHVNSPIIKKKPVLPKPANTAAENCENNIDDDGNGLIDHSDFSCYFNAANPDTCIPSKVIWGSYSYYLYWVNLETNEDHRLAIPSLEMFDDIAWSPNGKLYGIDRWTGQIREIDPYTGETKFVSDVPGYYYSNGLTADAAGNFYLTSFVDQQKSYIVKLNISTGQVTVIADLFAKNLTGGGDLTFLNGFLYAACEGGKIVKIDLRNNSMEILTTSIFTTGFGLITLGDGYLYSCSVDEIYRIDPVTMETSFYYKNPTYGYMMGMTSYAEHCNAPGCRARLKINIQSSEPYCSNNGVLLKATGTGIKGASDYTWTLPGGQTKTGHDTLTAFISGTYHLKYHTLPDTCGAIDSVTLDIKRFPVVSLGKDTLICSGQSILLHPSDTADIDSYHWQDGSSLSNYTATAPGIFWLESYNACGSYRDSVLLSPATLPAIFIGNDTLLCPTTSVTIKNNIPGKISDLFMWSTGSSAGSIMISQPGIYWLQGSNTCGIVKDSIIILPKDSCICNPIFPALNLGPDKELCKYDTLALNNYLHSADFRYTWQDGSRENHFTVKEAGLYWADVSTYCGTIRDTVIITEKTEDCECLLHIPSAFTPNTDGKNDLFRPLSNCILSGRIKIYNRWGNLVFSSNNLSHGWDGYYNGRLQPNDVYVYYITYNFLNRPGHYNRKGSLVLIR